MMLLTFVIMIILISIIEFKSHCENLPFRFHRLTKEQLEELNVSVLSQKKGKLNVSIHYRFKKVEIITNRRRFTPMNIIGQAEIYKGNKRICSYTQLPPSFKTTLYAAYMEVRYPKTLSKVIYYTSTNKKTKFHDFCLKEDLFSFHGGSNYE